VIALMGADDAVIAALTPEQRALVDEVIDRMNPAAPRAAGAAFDNRAALPNTRIAAVRAPTLIVHAEDDRLQLFHNAEFAVRTIPAARMVSFARGGHLLMAVALAAVREAVRSHIHAVSRAGSGEGHAHETPAAPLTSIKGGRPRAA
jgi:pimeloyl-ACP methyl ester carboxylesterase